jgi:hypothetical protein
LGGILVSFLTSLLKFKPPSSDASIGCKAIPVEWSTPFSLPFLFLSSSRPDSLSSHPTFWFPLELTCGALFIAQPASALSIDSKSAQNVALPTSRTLSTPQKAKAEVYGEPDAWTSDGALTPKRRLRVALKTMVDSSVIKEIPLDADAGELLDGEVEVA